MKLLFIFSLPRSGSTLLQRLLSVHPKISTAPEPWLLLPFCYATKSKGVFSEYDHGTGCNALSSLIYKLPNCQDDYYEALRQFVYHLYEKLSDENSVYFLDKTPRYYLIIQEIAKIFPDAKFIFLFRNPLQVLASVINTWHKGRFRLERNYMDLYLGPQLLAESYALLQHRSTKILFDDLIDNPEKFLADIFGYLDLDYNPEILKNFHTQKFDGQLGDKEGYYKYDQIDSEVSQNWKNTISTKYRKKVFMKYISSLSSQTLKVFGYSHDQLKTLVEDIRPVRSGSFQDRFDILVSNFFRIFEIPLFMRKVKVRLESGESFVIHR